ncbi:hypothetical protein WJX77_002306 [Trebouxia sp. C0004]
MASKACVNRLQKEYKGFLKDPPPNIQAHPSPNNLLEWHYALEGAKGTEYEAGVYHGKVTFPADYPYKPPSIVMLTASGRFSINTKLCLSMTDFHPESWNPMWSVGTILNGLLSFMYENDITTGSMSSSKAEKRRLASMSLEQNLRSPMFRKLFPEWVEEYHRRQKINEEQEAIRQAQPAKQPVPVAAAKVKSTLGSTLITLSIVASVFALLMVPLFSK